MAFEERYGDDYEMIEVAGSGQTVVVTLRVPDGGTGQALKYQFQGESLFFHR